jgi:hypothetical protein
VAGGEPGRNGAVGVRGPRRLGVNIQTAKAQRERKGSARPAVGARLPLFAALRFAFLQKTPDVREPVTYSYSSPLSSLCAFAVSAFLLQFILRYFFFPLIFVRRLSGIAGIYPQNDVRFCSVLQKIRKFFTKKYRPWVTFLFGHLRAVNKLFAG